MNYHLYYKNWYHCLVLSHSYSHQSGLELIQIVSNIIVKSRSRTRPGMVCYHMCQNSNYLFVTWHDSICDTWCCDISSQSTITFHHLGKFEYWYSPNYHHIIDTCCNISILFSYNFTRLILMSRLESIAGVMTGNDSASPAQPTTDNLVF